MTPSLTQVHSLLMRRPLLYIFICFALVQIILYLYVGVFTGLEAEKYVTEGNLLYTAGHLSETKYIFYLPVILLVYCCRLLHASYTFAALIQIAVSAISLSYYYRLSLRVGSKHIALYSSILLAIFFPLQAWNLFLYSDSLFISLTIIYTYIVYTQGDKGTKGTVKIIGFLLLLLFTRPHGLLFIPPTIIYLLFRKQSRASFFSGLAICLLLLTGMYLLLNMAFTGGGDMDAMKPFIEEHIICFVPMRPEGAKLDIVKTASPVYDIFYYMVHNPAHFLRLMGLKLLSFFNMTRAYYSTLHNLFLIIFLVPVYLFSIPGIVCLIKTSGNFMIFLCALLILYPLGATFQCDDWHSRFTMVVLPYFFLLATTGLSGMLMKKRQSL
jgi:hypothetical protein